MTGHLIAGFEAEQMMNWATSRIALDLPPDAGHARVLVMTNDREFVPIEVTDDLWIDALCDHHGVPDGVAVLSAARYRTYSQACSLDTSVDDSVVERGEKVYQGVSLVLFAGDLYTYNQRSIGPDGEIRDRTERSRGGRLRREAQQVIVDFVARCMDLPHPPLEGRIRGFAC